MTLEELHHKDVIQARTGANLGRADDLAFSPETGRIEGLILHGRPRLFGLLGRDETLTIPCEEIDKIGLDAVLVRTELPMPEQKSASFWHKLRRWLDG